MNMNDGNEDAKKNMNDGNEDRNNNFNFNQ